VRRPTTVSPALQRPPQLSSNHSTSYCCIALPSALPLQYRRVSFCETEELHSMKKGRTRLRDASLACHKFPFSPTTRNKLSRAPTRGLKRRCQARNGAPPKASDPVVERLIRMGMRQKLPRLHPSHSHPAPDAFIRIFCRPPLEKPFEPRARKGFVFIYLLHPLPSMHFVR
jgi:hypothetical protein